MGILCFRVKEETTMIKTAIVAFCAALAAAQPEADSDAFLGNFGYGYNNYNNGFYGKREADAEPEAKADGYFGNYGYGYNNFGYGYSPAMYSGFSSPAFSNYGYGYNRFYNNYNNGFYGKRDAEAKPEA